MIWIRLNCSGVLLHDVQEGAVPKVIVDDWGAALFV